MTSSRACLLATCQDTAAGYWPHVLLNIPTIAALPSGVRLYTGPPESPFWLTTPLAIVNQPLFTASTVPQLSPLATPKWQTCWPAAGTITGSTTSGRPPGSTSFSATSGSSAMVSQSVIGWSVATVAPLGVLSVYRVW